MKTAFSRPGKSSLPHPVIGGKIVYDNLGRFLEDYFHNKPSILREEMKNREVEDEMANLITRCAPNKQTIR